MDQAALVSLLAELFAAIRLVSGYPGPETLPEVHVVPRAALEREVCGGRSCGVKAYYHPERGVFVDEALDLRGNAFDRSVLLHELVHHLQKTTGKFDAVAGLCYRRNAQELEAYEIQNRYLSRQQASRRAVAVGWTGRCDDAS
jgi:hypothetical protein